MQRNPATEPFGFVLTDAARLLRTSVDRALEAAGLDITPGDARILAVLDQLGPMRQSALASRLMIEPMTVIGHIDRLEKLGLVERLPDPGDRRAKLIRPTEAAVAEIRRIRGVVTGARQQALRGFTPAEQETLHALLLRLRDGLAEETAR